MIYLVFYLDSRSHSISERRVGGNIYLHLNITTVRWNVILHKSISPVREMRDDIRQRADSETQIVCLLTIHLEVGQDVLGHLEALCKDLPIHINGNVPVAKNRFVSNIQAASPDPLGGEDSVPVSDQGPGPVSHLDVDPSCDGGLELRGQYHHPELDGVAGPVDRLVCLDEDGVSLVLVFKVC